MHLEHLVAGGSVAPDGVTWRLAALDLMQGFCSLEIDKNFVCGDLVECGPGLRLVSERMLVLALAAYPTQDECLRVWLGFRLGL